MNKKWTMLAGAALSVALLAGCGSKAGNNDAGAAPAQAAAAEQSGAGGAGDQAGAAGTGVGRGGMQAMGTLGKIKSVSGGTITIYKSAFQPGQGGGRQGGNRQSAGGQADGQAGGQDSGQTGGQASGQAGGQGRQDGQRADMANLFTEETEEIKVTDATKIYKSETADGERTETEIALGDLKADDVITVTLKEGTQEAESIRLGGFGGGGFGGMRGGQGQGLEQGQGQEQE
ncbi:hypothetical protein [Cohnella sp. JJ-181]|uniref:hypothetical protein n=1 Tax=Cohnella rhizoplanae TaxID=2974897 RepID=UPI0022FF6242|nr:hypothetical protein [Cohnella sp. JJ-181]CAI6054287.1 hypothetical protein COHCIP112018_01608 [Cohnella sp. JJ-181]